MIALNKAIQGWQNLYKNSVLEVSFFEHHVWGDLIIETSRLIKAVRHFKY